VILSTIFLPVSAGEFTIPVPGRTSFLFSPDITTGRISSESKIAGIKMILMVLMVG
jgi:hypothetical protein